MLFDNFLLSTLVLIVILVAGWLFMISQNTRNTREQIRRIAEQHTIINADERARRLCIAVHQLHPLMHAGVDFSIERGDAEHEPHLAEWNASVPKPTPEELEEALSRIGDKGYDYAALRRSEYPSVGDQLDAAFKARLGNETEQMRIDDKITEVKEKYPKADAC